MAVVLHSQCDPAHVAADAEGDQEAEGTHPRSVVALRATTHKDVHKARQYVHLHAHVGRIGVRRLLVDGKTIWADVWWRHGV